MVSLKEEIAEGYLKCR